MASSWPGVLDVGRLPFSYPNAGPSFENHSMSPWSGSNYGGHEMNPPAGFNNGFLFLYETNVPGRQAPPMQQPMSPMGSSHRPSPAEHAMNSASPTGNSPSRCVPSSAPVPVQHPQGKRNGQYQHGSATSAPRAISGKVERRRVSTIV